MGLHHVDRLAILTVFGTQGNALFAHLIREKFTFTVIKSTGTVIRTDLGTSQFIQDAVDQARRI